MNAPEAPLTQEAPFLSPRRELFLAGTILGLGLLCRLVLAFSRVDLVWPDEQFQTLEPAGKLVFGHAFLSWEWLKGYRTWLLPLFFTPPLALAKSLGITSGLGLLYLSRAYIAFLDIIAWYLLLVIARALELGAVTRFILLMFVAFAPSSLLWGVTTLQDHLSQILLLVAVAYSVRTSALRDSPRSQLTSGFLFGWPGWVKLQSGFFSAGYVVTSAVLSWVRNEPRRIPLTSTVRILIGGALALLCIGISDWITWGQFAGSVVRQVQTGESISRFYGVSPWTDGFNKIYDLIDPLFWSTLAFGCVGLVFARNRPRVQIKIALPMIVGLLGFVMFHFWVPHKEVRFFLPILPFLVLLWGVTWDSPLRTLTAKLGSFVHRLPRPVSKWGLVISVSSAIGISAGWGLTQALRRPLYLSSVDTAELEDQIARLKPLLIEDQKICIILGGHNWSWARGALIVGAPVEYFEIKAENLGQQPIPSHCHVALIEREKSQSFLTAHPDFTFLLKGKNRFDLWGRKGRLPALEVSTSVQ